MYHIGAHGLQKKISKKYIHRRHAGGGGLMYWGMLMPNDLIALKINYEKPKER